ncbi:(2Fe-2S)-binding protein [Pseudonocardia acidicola]|uniref:(2Fe-2S)-binding protein n=1 Tax=Pseudonocardia acidicola TaxID=2724939 RepID=A0ABX1S4F0_9PSEU|nr:(2Fe-2S)-binding protein [Pseudonocardia acidicola]NMH96425.1 (2Fe-2S)-binding protein [Pseudonocardia acidicola]
MTLSLTSAVAETAARVSAAVEGLDVRVGPVRAEDGWTRCDEVGAAFVARWEAETAAALPGWYGRTHPTTASAFVLHWCADLPGLAGAAFLRHARRVPRLDRAALAFRRDPGNPVPAATGLLDDRFWCLPDDPAADDPAATVVADEHALAAVLRGQIRGHADEFLADYPPGRPLPRRALLGAFFDGLDAGVWRGADGVTAYRDESAMTVSLQEAALVLPGGTPLFPEPSTLHPFVDARDRIWLSRRRVSCCYYFKVSAAGTACSTCPRTSPAERAQRYADLAD